MMPAKMPNAAMLSNGLKALAKKATAVVLEVTAIAPTARLHE